jgi:hypothetical protein
MVYNPEPTKRVSFCAFDGRSESSERRSTPAGSLSKECDMSSPFDGSWTVLFYEMRDRDGGSIGLPFGPGATLVIQATRTGAVTVTLEPPPPNPPIFEGWWSGGDDPSLSVEWVDEETKFLYQLVALGKDLDKDGKATRLVGGYFRASVPRGDLSPKVDSEGTGSWLGTGPILPLPVDQKRG